MANKNPFTKVTGIGRSIFKTAENLADKGVKFGKDTINNAKIDSEISKLKDKILEHQYNIGKLIYDNEIDVDDGFVISNVNSIDRLVEELKKLEGSKNG